MSRRIVVRRLCGDEEIHTLSIVECAERGRHGGFLLYSLVSVIPYSGESAGVEYSDFPIVLTETASGLFSISVI